MKITDRKVKGYMERPAVTDENGDMVGVLFLKRGRTAQQPYEVVFYHRFANEYGTIRSESVFPYAEKHIDLATAKFKEAVEFILRWGLAA